MPNDAKVVIRLGSHSEKEYVEKTIRYLDGVMVGANLVETTPAATASLLFKLSGSTGRPYYIDPMTYAYGAYYDPMVSAVRDDLDWIKSDQKVKGSKSKTVRAFKSSYRKLADQFGQPFSTALNRGTAVSLADFPSDTAIAATCRAVLDYQANKVRSIFAEDSETANLSEDMPRPAAIFAPYFYIEESDADAWIELNRRFAACSSMTRTDCAVHLVVCCHRSILTDGSRTDKIIEYVNGSACAGVWLWFSKFDEHGGTDEELDALASWVRRLAPMKHVFNMHGGYFSMILNKLGMSGIAHGVGYGEQKDVVPVIGQSTPTIQYYVRSAHAKFSVAQITRCFSALKITTPQHFFDKICDCVICKGIIEDNLANFAQFGEIHYSTPTSKRPAQTPAAAKRCRFHFLLNRIKERNFVNASDLNAIVANLASSHTEWSKTILRSSLDHLKAWENSAV
ncbi:MAG: hypothetical protein WA374_18570 [Acidobacteriaceae bacterium]